MCVFGHTLPIKEENNITFDLLKINLACFLAGGCFTNGKQIVISLETVAIHSYSQKWSKLKT